MALVLTGAVQYTIRYKDDGGTERTVRIKKGTDIETLGLPASVLENLAAETYGTSTKKWHMFTSGEAEAPRKATVKVKASKNEAGVPESTISMVGMRKELAADRAARQAEEKERAAESRKQDGIRRTVSEPAFDKTPDQLRRERQQIEAQKAQEAAEEAQKVAEPVMTVAPNVDASAVEAEAPMVEAVVEMDAEVTKAEEPKTDEAPQKAPVKRKTTKKTTKKSTKKKPS